MNTNIYKSISKLIAYGRNTGLLLEQDFIYETNQILHLLQLEEYEPVQIDGQVTREDLETILSELLQYAEEKHLIEPDSIVSRDLFDTKIMNCLMPRPSQVIATFKEAYSNSPKEATDYYYQLSKDSDYIRTYRVKKDMK